MIIAMKLAIYYQVKPKKIIIMISYVIIIWTKNKRTAKQLCENWETVRQLYLIQYWQTIIKIIVLLVSTACRRKTECLIFISIIMSDAKQKKTTTNEWVIVWIDLMLKAQDQFSVKWLWFHYSAVSVKFWWFFWINICARRLSHWSDSRPLLIGL